LPLERIAEISQEHAKFPEKRLAQRTLAEEVVTLVHRAEVAEKCIFQTAALYPAPRNNANTQEKHPQLKAELILRAFRGDDAMLKRVTLSSVSDLPLPRLLKDIGLASSISMFS
jgi:tyrosyl-tRNA synthetase